MEKQVAQYEKDTLEFVELWDSVKEAGETLGFSTGNIYKAANGELKSYKGFVWSWVGNEPKRPTNDVQVFDEHGTLLFEMNSPRELAELWQCHVSQIYRVMNKDKKIRGCHVRYK